MSKERDEICVMHLLARLGMPEASNALDLVPETHPFPIVFGRFSSEVILTTMATDFCVRGTRQLVFSELKVKKVEKKYMERLADFYGCSNRRPAPPGRSFCDEHLQLKEMEQLVMTKLVTKKRCDEREKKCLICMEAVEQQMSHKKEYAYSRGSDVQCMHCNKSGRDKDAFQDKLSVQDIFVPDWIADFEDLIDDRVCYRCGKATRLTFCTQCGDAVHAKCEPGVVDETWTCPRCRPAAVNVDDTKENRKTAEENKKLKGRVWKKNDHAVWKSTGDCEEGTPSSSKRQLLAEEEGKPGMKRTKLNRTVSTENILRQSTSESLRDRPVGLKPDMAHVATSGVSDTTPLRRYENAGSKGRSSPSQAINKPSVQNVLKFEYWSCYGEIHREKVDVSEQGAETAKPPFFLSLDTVPFGGLMGVLKRFLASAAFLVTSLLMSCPRAVTFDLLSQRFVLSMSDANVGQSAVGCSDAVRIEKGGSQVSFFAVFGYVVG
ncbi:unnamed protein product [Toxocara canis]|uniref:PHD domain-containing protein n=1 Tax=Toxocara canis TaxID=6265 RepID=A0A183UM76_TOXCA|nr:unnamed protein product [Toxocara canis]